MLRHPEKECGSASAWLWTKPDSIKNYLEYVNARYNLSTVYVTEFGVDVKNASFMPKKQALMDTYREEYYRLYLEQIAHAKTGGVPVKGIFAWSLMDNFEWGDGLAY